MRLRQLLARMLAERTGAALVEFAIVAPVLAVMLVGLVDLSTYISTNLAVQRAARAGGEYAVNNGFSVSGVSAAVSSSTAQRSGYMSAISVDPAPSQWCGCPNATTGVAVQACGTKCTSGLDAGTYVTAGAKASYSPVFPWPGFSTSVQIASTTTVRIE